MKQFHASTVFHRRTYVFRRRTAPGLACIVPALHPITADTSHYYDQLLSNLAKYDFYDIRMVQNRVKSCEKRGKLRYF